MEIVTIPTLVQMSIAEITNLFETTQAVVKKCIKQIEKQGVIKSYNTSSCIVIGNKIVCDYYGLETIVAVSFQLQSIKARLFREWILQKLTCSNLNLESSGYENWKNISLN